MIEKWTFRPAFMGDLAYDKAKQRQLKPQTLPVMFAN